jgi:hypothetical protein
MLVLGFTFSRLLPENEQVTKLKKIRTLAGLLILHNSSDIFPIWKQTPLVLDVRCPLLRALQNKPLH